MAPRLNLGRVEENAARRAGTPRGEKKLGLRIESDVSLRDMKAAAGHRYRLPTNGKLGSGGQVFGYIIDVSSVPLLAAHRNALVCNTALLADNCR
jgi:hypothetical protein